MKLHPVKLHRVHRRLFRGCTAIYYKSKPHVSFCIVVTFYQYHVLYRSKLPKKFGKLIFLYPQRKVPDKDFPFFSMLDLFGLFRSQIN
ncbi:hypothetical protein HanIR_Chr11g0504161 [Helianthus annuus]|nr:hypothetical protein HanIR_Chr11g0504161 [Helianthus annuus]